MDILLVFIFGLMVGSFLNVVVYTLESSRASEDDIDFKNKSKREDLSGRSFCPNCKHELSAKYLIPVLSYVILRGKCRYCKKKISIQYPLVEIFTGIIFIAIFYFFGLGSQALSLFELNIYSALKILSLFIISCLLIIIFVYDLKHKIIPDKIIYPAIGLTFVYLLGTNGNELNPAVAGYQFFSLNSAFVSSILSALGAASFFYLIAAVSNGRAMGGGDIKLAFFMGLLLGWPKIIVGIFLGFFLGAIVGILLLCLNKAGRKSEIPFGPFLITGTWVALFYGDIVVKWYLSTLGF